MENQKNTHNLKPPAASEFPDPDDPNQNGKSKTGAYVWELVRFIILSLLIVIPIRIYIAQPYIVSGASMEPTFHGGEYLIADQITYRLEEPQRGDVIIMRYPEQPSKFFIKRIIGLPGETLRLTSGTVAIATASSTEMVLAEPYIEMRSSDEITVALGDTEYYVLGDNRRASLDSRIFGPLDRKFIVGKILVRLFPVTKVDFLPGHYLYETPALK